MEKLRSWGALAAMVAVGLAALAGCSSGSPSTGGSGPAAGSITGQVPRSFIQEPSAGLIKQAGVTLAAARAAVAEARKLTWSYVQAGGVTQAATCTGSGSPTVVYSNGLIVPAAWTWPAIAAEQAKTNRICMFDRPGTGLSPARPDSAAPNGPEANANELYALMTALGEKGPFELVGWSYGGMVVRTAAALQPSQVAGLNLIDAVTPTQYRTFDTHGWSEGGQELDMAKAEQIVGTGPDLGAKPLVVLQAGRDPGTQAKKDEWAGVQRQAASISTNSIYGVVTDSAHTIPQTSPAAVVAADTAISTSATSGQPMPVCPASFAPSGIVCQPRSQASS